MSTSLFKVIMTVLGLLISDASAYSEIGVNSSRYHGERNSRQLLLNFLNLRNLLKVPCTTNDGKQGLCLNNYECGSSGGISKGACLPGLLSCCVFQGTCGETSSRNGTYFVNPDYPSPSSRLDQPVCIFTVRKLNPGICQVRLDFLEFSLSQPENGSCADTADSLRVGGATSMNQTGLPPAGLCGNLLGQHMYLDVARTDQPLLLIISQGVKKYSGRIWSILVSQIPCDSPYRAPSGCLQYYQARSGIAESFNFERQQQSPNQISPSTQSRQRYFNQLDYAICLRKIPNTCGVTWSAVDDAGFDIGGHLTNTASTGQNCIDLNTGEGDYVVIVGGSADGRTRVENRFCGQRLNEDNGVTNIPILSFTKPYILYVHTDNVGPQIDPSTGFSLTQRGFRLRYEEISCSSERMLLSKSAPVSITRQPNNPTPVKSKHMGW